MKTYIFTILLLWTGFLCQPQSKSVSATTTFNGFHCDGKQGICDIDNTNRSQANSTLVWNPNHTITFCIARKNLTVEEQQSITGTTVQNFKKSETYYFEVFQVYPLPQYITESFSINGNQLIVAKGAYPILITEETFTITFNLE